MDSKGFAPLARPDAETLVLGSLPGQESLRRREYYAQPRNAFWPIMGELIGADPKLPYAERVEKLLGRRIAVWDVCRSAFRAGSLDSAIVRDSIVVNDFGRFLDRHPKIRRVCFNGATAEDLYGRLVVPILDTEAAGLPRHRLPSTSPAHASLTFAEKRDAWRLALLSPRPRRARRSDLT